MIQHSVIPYAGWDSCLRIENGILDLIVTLEVGPRIIRCGYIGEPNLFVEYPDQIGKKGETTYHSYGGHRLWIAPEEHPKTIYPDNAPVQWKQDGEWFHFIAPPEATGFQKELHVTLDPDKEQVRVRHRITNISSETRPAAAWAVTVMAPGGRAIVPQEPQRSHQQALLPVRPVVLWAYTDMSDKRWNWGSKYIQLRQDPSATAPQKAGFLNSLGWCAYENRKSLFLKKFPFIADATFPDFQSNCEIFTNTRMLELESLSALKSMSPGDSLTHEEGWFVFRDIELGSSQAELDHSMEPLLKTF